MTHIPAATRESSRRLNLAEKALLKQMDLRPEERVLDLFVRDGALDEYIGQAGLCGLSCVSDSLEDVYALRETMPGCDINYSSREDIPWYDETFDKVMLRNISGTKEEMLMMLDETVRVLKCGGSFYAALNPMTATLTNLLGLATEADEAQMLNASQWQEMLESIGFIHFATRRVGPDTLMLCATKRGLEECGEMLA